jgi:hypothetical protein
MQNRTTQTSSSASEMKVIFRATGFPVPINFGRLSSGDAKGKKLWRHPFTLRVAIRTLRIPAQKFTGVKPKGGQPQ